MVGRECDRLELSRIATFLVPLSPQSQRNRRRSDAQCQRENGAVWTGQLSPSVAISLFIVRQSLSFWGGCCGGGCGVVSHVVISVRCGRSALRTKNCPMWTERIAFAAAIIRYCLMSYSTDKSISRRSDSMSVAAAMAMELAVVLLSVCE